MAAGLDRRDAAVVSSWAYFIWTGSINTIWPMFGIANQLLASVALAVGTTIIINMGRRGTRGSRRCRSRSSR